MPPTTLQQSCQFPDENQDIPHPGAFSAAPIQKNKDTEDDEEENGGGEEVEEEAEEPPPPADNAAIVAVAGFAVSVSLLAILLKIMVMK